MLSPTIDSVLMTIADLRNELHNLDYNEEAYDIKENELHDIEDGFLRHYGADLHSLITRVYEENRIEPPVLTPLAYIPRSFIKNVDDKYDVDLMGGAVVDVTDKPGPFYLSLVPGPMRLILLDKAGKRRTLWNSDNQ